MSFSSLSILCFLVSVVVLTETKKQLKCRICLETSTDGADPVGASNGQQTTNTCSKENAANERVCAVGVEKCFTLEKKIVVNKKAITITEGNCVVPTTDLDKTCRVWTKQMETQYPSQLQTLKMKCKSSTCENHLCNGETENEETKKQLQCRSCHEVSIDGGKPKGYEDNDGTYFTCSKAKDAGNEEKCMPGVEECATMTITYKDSEKKVKEKLGACNDPEFNLDDECKSYKKLRTDDGKTDADCQHSTCKSNLCNSGIIKGISTVLLTAVLALVAGLY